MRAEIKVWSNWLHMGNAGATVPGGRFSFGCEMALAEGGGP